MTVDAGGGGSWFVIAFLWAHFVEGEVRVRIQGAGARIFSTGMLGKLREYIA